MSYTVAIVTPPVPAEDARAWPMLEAWRAETGPRPATFEKLHAQLTARFPCIDALDDDDADDGVWSDGPLINNFGHRVAVLRIVSEFVDEVLPFVIASATALGLIVFDEQTGTIHRP